jgi:uncharacterized Fe-S center protein
MKSNVYLMDFRAGPEENLLDKLQRLLNRAGIADVVSNRDLVAVKMHFGEAGNTAFIPPVYLRQIVSDIKRVGGEPFLTDCNTLYVGARSDAPHHLVTATQNGFAYAVVDAPLVIADGLRGRSETAVSIDQKNFATAYVGKDITEADALLSVAHFKGHELSGFGGTIKNVGMGCASRRGKLAQHSTVAPSVNEDGCIGCGTCLAHCPKAAISMLEEIAAIDHEKCIGCGGCILMCPSRAIEVQWDQTIPVFLENMVEYTYGVLKDKPMKSLFLNFITHVSPGCDCLSHNDAPIVKDIGVLASRDPVAVDQAAADLVNQEPALAQSELSTHTGPGEDKFTGLYPEVDWTIQLAYAQKIKLGSRDYRLISI